MRVFRRSSSLPRPGWLVAMIALVALTLPVFAAVPQSEAAETAAETTNEQEQLQSAGAFTRYADTDPATGALAGFGATGSVAFDYQRRSVGADLSAVKTVRRIELVDRDDASRLTTDDYTLWVSQDNIAYEEVTGWSWSAEVVNGQLVHTFDGFEAAARYVKINTRYEDTAYTFVLANLTRDVRVYGDPLAAPPSNDPDFNDPDASFNIVDRGVAFAKEGVSAFRPAITRAPNGDILATFNTSGDVQPGGEVRLIRSTDDGLTWSDSRVIKTSEAWGSDGSIYSSRGMTTLSDGTILLPINDGINHSPFNNRDSELYVARSVDSGNTWAGLDDPVELPVETREHWACCSRILELDDESLLMTLWGTRELVDDWQQDPMRWRAAVVKSYDGGRTWEDYSTIAYDPHSPPGSRGNGSRGSGISEPSIVQLDSGRLVAMVRFDESIWPTDRDQGFSMYLSYSDDRGATWTDPLPTDPSLQAATPSLAEAPASAALPEGQSKLIFGHRTMPRSAPGGDLAAVSVSFDEGVTWEGRTFLEEPQGLPKDAFRAAEPDFLQLDDGRLLTVFQYQPGFTGNYELGYNVLEDRSTEDTLADAQAAQSRAAQEPALFFAREDREDWPFTLALRQRSFPSSTLVSDVAAQAAEAVTCTSEQLQLVREGDPNRPLDPDKTLSEAGVRNGDTLIVRSLQPASLNKKVGITHWDAFPGTRHLYAWADDCDYGQEFDAQKRSIGVVARVPNGQMIDTVSLRDTDNSTRLTANDYSLWVSSDNDTFTEVRGWDLLEEVGDDGRLVHTFTGLEVTEPYLKIHQAYSVGAPTFILESLQDDVTVTRAPRE